MIINAQNTFPDFFPFFQSLENINWSLHNLTRPEHFIVLNHPKLNNAYKPEDLLKLGKIQAMEVFTPFGDGIEFWDQVLSYGRPILGFSSDDLHYFSDYDLEKIKVQDEKYKSWLRKLLHFSEEVKGESLQRYIMIYSPSKHKEDILKSLCQGSYVMIKEWGDLIIKKFEIKKLESNENYFKIEFNHPVLQILFKTNNGRILQETKNSNSAIFYFKNNPDSSYIRIEVWDIRGILLTNPVMKLNQKIENFCNH